MAGVVLQKLGRQLALAEAHCAAEAADINALIGDLDAALASDGAPTTIIAAIAALRRDRDNGALCALIGALYEDRASLGAARFEALLGRVRRTLRASIDRRMEFAA